LRARVIYNPSANHGRAESLQERIEIWEQDNEGLDLVLTKGPGQATDLARQAIDSGYELIVAAGGDGTIHEVVNGMVDGDKSRAILGLIPIGSGNDFTHGLGLNSDIDAAMRRLSSGEPRPIDLARIEDDRGNAEIVMNGIGIGFDATVSIQSRLITRVHGFAMYALAALRTIALYYQAPHMVIHFDGERVEQDSLMLSIGSGPRIGGGFHLTPDAIFDDGLLDSCTVNPINRPTMLRLLPDAMRGTHISSRHVTMRRSRKIEIESNIALPIHVDGEIFAYHEDNVHMVKITALPLALSIMGDAK